ncbi:hypothetical protein PIB30_025385 [Stylosanthes scabra]|uniref:Uncharacterized protein n=1 Tax=Stylosanthes scabra TaxID=79078 RepID=A0ABU6Z9M3_9FABA|nr:hypothetical protein [Stylosanthes scabra]
MGSRIIYYEIQMREKYEDSDEKVDSELAIVKTSRYHSDDENFVHPLHSIQFDLDRLCELPVESLLACQRRGPSERKEHSPQKSGPSRRSSSTPCYSPLRPITWLGTPSSYHKVGSSPRGQLEQGVVRLPKSRELILSSERRELDVRGR